MVATTQGEEMKILDKYTHEGKREIDCVIFREMVCENGDHYFIKYCRENNFKGEKITKKEFCDMREPATDHPFWQR